MPVRATMRLSPDDAAIALNGGLLAVDMAQMRRAGPNRPRVLDLIRERKIRYTRHDPAEHWQTYDEVLGQIQKLGFVFLDCEDISTLLAAEMRLGDSEVSDPDARIDVYRTGPNMSHVVTLSPAHGGRLDPSRWAGMGWDEPSEQAMTAYRAMLGLPGDPDGLGADQVGCQGMGCARLGAARVDVLAVLTHRLATGA